MAVTDAASMVRFYDEVLAARLQPIQIGSDWSHKGRLGGTVCVLPEHAPADRGREEQHPVDRDGCDLRDALRRAIAHGGQVLGDMREDADRYVCGLTDPDSNSLELVQMQ